MITELRGRPAYTPLKNVSYGRPPSTLDMGDAFSVYANPDPQSTRVVTLIAPPLYFSKNSYSTPLTMPLGLACLVAVLEKAHYRVKIVDCPGSGANHIYYTPNGCFKAQGMDEQRSIELIDPETDIIGVSIMFSQEWPQVRDYITRIRRAFPYAKIIVGGEHPTAMSEHTLRDCPAINYLVRGEGELTLLDLVYRLRSGEPCQGGSGITYLADGNFFQSPLSPPPGGHPKDALAQLAPHRRRALFPTQLYHGDQPWPQHRYAGDKRLSLSVHLLLQPLHVDHSVYYALGRRRRR
jgi:radical SAM superfamily enzyme YgiQ (UPF0313 family)